MSARATRAELDRRRKAEVWKDWVCIRAHELERDELHGAEGDPRAALAAVAHLAADLELRLIAAGDALDLTKTPTANLRRVRS